MRQSKVFALSSLIALAVSASLSVPMVHAQQFDSVVGTRGTPTFGTITAMSRTEIAISSSKGDKKYPVNEIQKVTYKGEPRELRDAREAIKKGQLEMARSMLEEISTTGITRPEILQDIQFYKAFSEGRLALVGGGDKAAAARAMLAFESNPASKNNYHYYAAMELLGDLAVSLSSFDKGVAYYKKLAEAPWPDYKMRANVLQANALVSDSKYADALKKYQEVLATSLDDANAREQKLLAMLGKAVCLAQTGKAQQGIDSVLEIIAENDSREKTQLFARAYNALGTCYLKAEKPQDALLAFLHVDLLFNQTPDAHAEALFHLSHLWKKVNKAERAIRARSVLENHYSGSTWANRK